MIYPKKNNIIYAFFRWYVPFIIRRNFKAVNFNTIDIDDNKSVLLIANHFSWWDAFLIYYVFSKLSNKKFYVMVLEETLNKHWFFNYMGAFSVDKTPAGIVGSLNYTVGLLNNPQNLVLIFPQGKLYSNFIDDIHFEKGIMKVIKNAGDKFQFVYAATFIENFKHKKPIANVYLSSETNCKFDDIEALNNSYQQHYNTSRQQQTKIIL